MTARPSRFFILAALLAVGTLTVFVLNRRAPACGGDGKIMTSQADCVSWGFDAATCKAAVEKARAATVRAAPRHEDSMACETQFTDCFEAQGGFYPRPSFCLRAEAKGVSEPFDLHYLEYESDRQNRKKTHEVPIRLP